MHGNGCLHGQQVACRPVVTRALPSLAMAASQFCRNSACPSSLSNFLQAGWRQPNCTALIMYLTSDLAAAAPFSARKRRWEARELRRSSWQRATAIPALPEAGSTW